MIAIDQILLSMTNAKTVLVAAPVNFDYPTAAVVSFVLMLLGMAAAFLLMLRFARDILKEAN